MRNLVGAAIPPELAAAALRVVEDIHAGRLGPEDSERVVQVIGQMTEVVMHHFFVRPTEAFGIGPALRGVVQFGVNSAVKTIRYGLGKVIPKLDRTQWSQLAMFLDQSLYDAGSVRK